MSRISSDARTILTFPGMLIMLGAIFCGMLYHTAVVIKRTPELDNERTLDFVKTCP